MKDKLPDHAYVMLQGLIESRVTKLLARVEELERNKPESLEYWVEKFEEQISDWENISMFLEDARAKSKI